MARELELAAGCEDADATRVGGVGRRENEGRLREVELARDRLHERGIEAGRVREHSQLVSTKAIAREDVAGVELERAHELKLARQRPPQNYSARTSLAGLSPRSS